jgi:hypothetical protein
LILFKFFLIALDDILAKLFDLILFKLLCDEALFLITIVIVVIVGLNACVELRDRHRVCLFFFNETSSLHGLIGVKVLH